MKTYNFDEIIDRTGTDCMKVDLLEERFGRKDLISLWVADMDFKTPDFIMDAIRKRCEHEILGYTFANQHYYETITQWLKKRHQLNVETSMLGFLPGIVPGLAFCVNCFSEPKDRVLVQTPVYPPFMSIPKHNDRILIENPLYLENGQFKMDFNQLESIIEKEKCKLFLLCNPHNPGGRCWNKEELMTLSDICEKNNVLVISDEIHADLALPGNTHVPFASVSEYAKNNSITLMAPSKTFNIAGLGSSFYFAHNLVLKKQFDYFLQKNQVAHGNIFAYIGAQAAFEKGESWLEQLVKYIRKNVLFVDDYLTKNIPQIKAILPEASFLMWLDCRELNLSQPDLVSFFINEAKLALNDGVTFGKQGVGFMRLNVGCSGLVLEQALSQLKSAVNKL